MRDPLLRLEEERDDALGKIDALRRRVAELEDGLRKAYARIRAEADGVRDRRTDEALRVIARELLQALGEGS